MVRSREGDGELIADPAAGLHRPPSTVHARHNQSAPTLSWSAQRREKKPTVRTSIDGAKEMNK